MDISTPGRQYYRSPTDRINRGSPRPLDLYLATSDDSISLDPNKDLKEVQSSNKQNRKKAIFIHELDQTKKKLKEDEADNKKLNTL